MNNNYICKCGNNALTNGFMLIKCHNTGLYCGECGKYIKWLNGDEIRLAKHNGIKLEEE